MQSRYITEQYIKTNIEEHVPKSLSTIRTYSIYKSMQTTTTNRYIELTGYKYQGRKGLVIGADRYYRTAARATGLPVDVAAVTYVELTEAEARDMEENIAVIRTKLKADKAAMSEEVYHDFTVNGDVFISVRRSASSSGSTYVYLWVKGEKYTMPASTLPKKLKKFLDY
jgi:hypothetical protein